MNVKNYEGSEILLYFKANKLAFHSFMVIDCKYDILSSETESVSVKAIVDASSLHPSFCRAMLQGPGDIFTLTGVHSRWRTSSFRNNNFLRKLLAKLFTYAPVADIIFNILERKQSFPHPYRKVLSLTSSAVYCTNILEKLIQNKSCRCLCSKDVQKYERPWRIISKDEIDNFKPCFMDEETYISENLRRMCHSKWLVSGEDIMWPHVLWLWFFLLDHAPHRSLLFITNEDANSIALNLLLSYRAHI